MKKRPTEFNTAAPDGAEAVVSTAHARNAFRDAYMSVPASEKTRAFTMLGAAGATTLVLFLSRLFWLFKPLLDKIYYGTLSEVVYYIFLGVLCTVYIIVLNNYLKKHCELRMFLPKTEKMTIPQALGIIAICAAAVFVASAAFGFKTKIQLEMGNGVTMAQALTNISVYFYYAFHMWLALAAATLVQRGLTLLFPAKHTLPWGAIFLVTVFGLVELVLELGTTDHVYPWLYYLFTYVYAGVFVLADYRFHVTYWASIVVMVL